MARLPQADSVETLLQTFQTSLSGTPAQQRKAALAVLERYGDYKQLVEAGSAALNPATMRALDEQIVQMCQETWRDVAIRSGGGLDHVVPIGSFGHRSDPTRHFPGKSDKDFVRAVPAHPKRRRTSRRASRRSSASIPTR